MIKILNLNANLVVESNAIRCSDLIKKKNTNQIQEKFDRNAWTD